MNESHTEKQALPFSGARFSVVYRISGEQPRDRAIDICIEQTVEFPQDLIHEPEICQQVFGRVEWAREMERNVWEVCISYAVEIAGRDIEQFLNVVFGNVSLQPGIRVQRLEVPAVLAQTLGGPRFGRRGIRERLGAWDRPLLCSALKPMGLSVQRLADMAGAFARGGLDVVKDDHGLANQSFCPFEERVSRCAEAVELANRETGGTCIYVPNVTASPIETLQRARFARAAGAGGVLVAPGLTGFGTMRALSQDDTVGLPVLCHPALLGSYVVRPGEGISPFALLGQIARLAGADACIFPSFGGRFSFSREECTEVASGCEVALPGIASIFPAPAGGITLDRVPELHSSFGSEVMFLIGGDLHREGPDLSSACRRFRRLVAVDC